MICLVGKSWELNEIMNVEPPALCLAHSKCLINCKYYLLIVFTFYWIYCLNFSHLKELLWGALPFFVISWYLIFRLRLGWNCEFGKGRVRLPFWYILIPPISWPLSNRSHPAPPKWPISESLGCGHVSPQPLQRDSRYWLKCLIESSSKWMK